MTTIIDISAASKNTKLQEKKSIDYTIINYDKKYVCYDDEETGKYRSVVVSNASNHVVAYGPKKSISMETFMERYPEMDRHIPIDVYVCEIVEGTMINLFFDKERNMWEIATKSAMGGQYWFYRQFYGNIITPSTEQYTFRQMFLEAIGESALSNLNDSYLVQNLDKSMSYSFVLQHPANHIVLDITVPKAYLVAIYEIQDSVIHYVPLENYYQEHPEMIHMSQHGVFYLPNRHMLWSNMCYTDLNTPNLMTYFPVGYMVVNSITGDRVTVKSENYERLKDIRGNHPNLQYQYLAIMRTGEITEFLHYFPIYKKLFHQFYEQMSEYVKSVHKLYLEIYVKKNKQLLENISKSIRYHLQNIHYQKHILCGQVITRTLMFEWLLYTLEPGQLLALLRGYGFTRNPVGSL